MVNVVTAESFRLKAMSADLKDQLDLLMQKLMSNERKWEEIMMMQVRVIFYRAGLYNILFRLFFIILCKYSTKCFICSEKQRFSFF